MTVHIGKREHTRAVHSLLLQALYNVSVRLGVTDEDGLSRLDRAGLDCTADIAVHQSAHDQHYRADAKELAKESASRIPIANLEQKQARQKQRKAQPHRTQAAQPESIARFCLDCDILLKPKRQQDD